MMFDRLLLGFGRSLVVFAETFIESCEHWEWVLSFTEFYLVLPFYRILPGFGRRRSFDSMAMERIEFSFFGCKKQKQNTNKETKLNKRTGPLDWISTAVAGDRQPADADGPVPVRLRGPRQDAHHQRDADGQRRQLHHAAHRPHPRQPGRPTWVSLSFYHLFPWWKFPSFQSGPTDTSRFILVNRDPVSIGFCLRWEYLMGILCVAISWLRWVFFFKSTVRFDWGFLWLYSIQFEWTHVMVGLTGGNQSLKRKETKEASNRGGKKAKLAFAKKWNELMVY